MNLEKIKKYLPNTLTISRIILTPIIMFTFLTNNFIPTTFLIAYSMITDFLDGYLSRKWNTTSKLGAILDQIADKTLAIGALLISLKYVPILSINLIFEGAIASINIISKSKGNNTNTLFSGKVKTWGLFITLASSIVTKFIPELLWLSNTLSVITITLQSKALYDYYQNYSHQEKAKKKDIDTKKDFKHIKFDNTNDNSKNNDKKDNIHNNIVFLEKLKEYLVSNNQINNQNKDKKTKIKK